MLHADSYGLKGVFLIFIWDIQDLNESQSNLSQPDVENVIWTIPSCLCATFGYIIVKPFSVNKVILRFMAWDLWHQVFNYIMDSDPLS